MTYSFKYFVIAVTLAIASVSAVASDFVQGQTVDLFFSTSGSDGQVVTGYGNGIWGSNPGLRGGGPGMLINFTDVQYGTASYTPTTVTNLTNSSSNIGDTGGGQYLYLNLSFQHNGNWYNDQATIHAITLNSGDSVNIGGITPYTALNSSTTFYALTGGAAPEIDGSLAPKVGFLLGCLFLMFGRKKQNTEALLTA